MINPPGQIFVSLKPLGAGDLIDRAVRFYRKYFWTFVSIAAPPVIVGTLISVGWTMLGREMFSIGANRYSPDNTFYYLFLKLGNVVIWLAEVIATLVVMGGASRNFVRHILFAEPITFRETYKNASKRLFGLIGASTIITVLLGVIGTIIFYFGILVATLAILLVVWAFSFLPVVAVILSVAVGIGVGLGTLWLFVLVASRFAYVPQVMLVEGQGVFPAIGRSASLAGGNVRRLMALFVFTTLATYSALALLYVPVAWYAWANGIELFTFGADLVPAWVEIANSIISQISFTLLSPVWTVGLCLLYVDERVRTEGYDIELMAARRLGDIPSVPMTYINPLQPALSTATYVAPVTATPVASAVRKETSSYTTLGLD